MVVFVMMDKEMLEYGFRYIQESEVDSEIVQAIQLPRSNIYLKAFFKTNETINPPHICTDIVHLRSNFLQA